MKIQFCGAAQEVTGSAHLITLNSGYRILLDCGLYQGSDESMEDFNKKWYFNPETIDLLILSHAHIDHAGRIPKLFKDGFTGEIIATHATRSLCSIMLLDSAKIQESDAEYENKKLKKRGSKRRVEPLYGHEHVYQAMQRFVTYNYGEWHRIHPEVELMFTDAGHILGSASVNLKVHEGDEVKTLGFTGDIGRPDRPILRDPEPMPASDFVITESTYGNRLHESKPEEAEKLLSIIKHTCIEKRGKLIIPAFSVGRTQEIVYLMDQMANKGLLPHIPIYVDSPLAVNATTIYGAHPECYDQQLNEYLLMDENPFGFNALTYVRSVEMSKSLNHSRRPSVIISASGMMTAGRIRHHMYHNLTDEKNTFLIVGYCAPNTAGALLKGGIEELKLFGDWLPVNADIQTMDSFSAHADRNEMIDFLQPHKKKAKRTFLVHGDYDAQKVFKKHLEKDGFEGIKIPKLGEEVLL